MKLYLTAKTLLLALFFICGSAQSSLGQEADAAKKRLDASPRHHEWVEVKTKAGRTVRAFLVYPEVSQPVPGVLVIHENRGLTDWVRSVADQLAEAGFVALAPDLLSQTGPEKGATDSFASSDAARDAIYKLPPEQVLEDLDACATYLRKLEASNKKIAVAGFCWGGAQSFTYAAHNPDLIGAFVFYGSAPTDSETLKKIQAPVYGFYGGNDFRITNQVPKTKELMDKLGKRYEPITYKDAGHAFMRSGEESNAEPANRDAMKEAWQRWKKLLKESPHSRPATKTGS
jgi:carboxymethylenebutenolidase